MIEINWSEIDPKYKFAAMDAGGGVYVFENKPKVHCMGVWSSAGVILKIADTSGNWLDSLQERPTE